MRAKINYSESAMNIKFDRIVELFKYVMFGVLAYSVKVTDLLRIVSPVTELMRKIFFFIKL